MGTMGKLCTNVAYTLYHWTHSSLCSQWDKKVVVHNKRTMSWSWTAKTWISVLVQERYMTFFTAKRLCRTNTHHKLLALENVLSTLKEKKEEEVRNIFHSLLLFTFISAFLFYCLHQLITFILSTFISTRNLHSNNDCIACLFNKLFKCT